MTDKKLGILAIAVQKRAETAPNVNALLSQYGEKIIARMGVPHHERNLNIVSVVIESDEQDILSLIDKLSALKNVQVKSLTV